MMLPVHYRQMTYLDLFNTNSINLDPFTENFNTSFYMNYLIEWPELCIVAESPDGTLVGYVIGKVEGQGKEWHGHVSALSVSPSYRHAKVAYHLMKILEDVSEQFQCFFIDLFVKGSNEVAFNFYKKLGYTTYRVYKGYYSEGEDANDMRKCLSRDPLGQSLKINSK